MPIQSFWVENYKAFASRAEIQVRPLTLLFGYNSAGKSALLRSLPLLRESINAKSAPYGASPLALASDPARGITFEDLKCQWSDSTSIGFGVTWRSAIVNGLSFSVRDMADLKQQVIEKLIIHRVDKENIEATWEVPKDRRQSMPRRHILPARYLVSDGSQSELRSLRFEGLLPEVSRFPSYSIFLPDFLRAEKSFRRYLARVHWLQALRALPTREETFVGAPPSIGGDGSGTTQFLAYDHFTGGEVLDRVSDWYVTTTGHSLAVKLGAFRGKELFSMLLSPKDGTGRGVDLIDAGEGMGQVLPVVTMLAMASTRRLRGAETLVFEHPELHLHPGAHAALAGLFCGVANIQNCPRMLVETHSENFLLRVQLAIAKRELDPARVIVYWVHQDESGEAHADAIEFDELGRPIGDRWPTGLFSENVSQAREIIIARRKRQEV